MPLKEILITDNNYEIARRNAFWCYKIQLININPIL